MKSVDPLVRHRSIPRFQIHWSSVPPEHAPGLIADDCCLLTMWPALVNHDRCFENAGSALFGDNDEERHNRPFPRLSRDVMRLR